MMVVSMTQNIKIEEKMEDPTVNIIFIFYL